MAKRPAPTPPAPPRLASKEEVGARLPLPRSRDEEETEDEGTPVEQLREHLEAASESIQAALDALDEIEDEEG